MSTPPRPAPRPGRPDPQTPGVLRLPASLAQRGGGTGAGDNNANNQGDARMPPGIPLLGLALLIRHAVMELGARRGSTERQIRAYLVQDQKLPPGVPLRRALVFALREGFITRARWSVQAGVYGHYVPGNGGPYKPQPETKGAKAKAKVAKAKASHGKPKAAGKRG